MAGVEGSGTSAGPWNASARPAIIPLTVATPPRLQRPAPRRRTGAPARGGRPGRRLFAASAPGPSGKSGDPYEETRGTVGREEVSDQENPGKAHDDLAG